MIRRNSIFLSLVGALASFVAIQGAIYFFYKISFLTTALSLVFSLGFLVFLIQPLDSVLRFSKFSVPRISWNWQWLLGLGFVVSDLGLLAYFISARTDEALASPWQIIVFPAIALFALATFCLLLLARKVSGRVFAACLVLHMLVAYGVAETVYAYGFGFDPFIHRATEEYIAKSGYILPKKAFYNGQYVLVVALHWLTRLPIDWIDRALVPFLSVLTLPLLLQKFWQKFWPGETGAVNFWSVGLLIFPMLPLVFTTPNNLAVLFLLWTILLLPQSAWGDRTVWVLVAVLSGGLIIHPLVGTLALALAVSYWLCAKMRRRYLAVVVSCALNALLLPCLFALNNYLQGAPVFDFAGFISRWPNFLGLILSPYGAFATAPFTGWDILYAYQSLLPVLLAIFSIIGFWSIARGSFRAWAYASVGTATGSILAAGIMSMGIVLPDVISFEQSEFSLRLMQASGLVLMPIAIIGAQSLFRRWPVVALSALVAILATVGWYLSYPQYNNHVTYAGWGIDRADFGAAKFIREREREGSYVVLSDQMVSVAALRLYGFENFHYALPTGAPLYGYFLAMAHYRTGRETMDSVMDFVGTKRAYFLVHNYYPGFGWLDETCSAIADASWHIDGGRIAVFQFDR